MNKLVCTGLLLAAVLSAPSAVFAQANCDQLQAAIDDGMKEVTFQWVEGRRDDNFPRQTNRKLEQLTLIGMVQANLTLMQAAKCNFQKTPIKENTYMEGAFQCLKALNAPTERGAEVKPLIECDRTKWVRSTK